MDRWWNWFDLCLVILWIIDVVITSFFATFQEDFSSYFETFRIIRLVRALRVFRVARSAVVVQRLVGALAGSVKTLIFSFILLVFELYFFAACFVQGVSYYKQDEDWTIPDELNEAFGSMRQAYYSLYMSVTGGINWGLVLDKLYYLPTNFYGMLFIGYISITFFGVLNVITAVFIDSAMQAVACQRDLIIQDKKAKAAIYVEHMKAIFKEIDQDKSGSVTLTEVEEIFTDEHLSDLMTCLELRPPDARSMFKLLDADGSGSVDIEEFCSGCLRLKGDARSFDVHCLLYESRRQIEKLTTLMSNSETSFTGLNNTMNKTAKSLMEHTNLLKTLSASSITSVSVSEQQLSCPSTCAVEGSSNKVAQLPLTLPHLRSVNH